MRASTRRLAVVAALVSLALKIGFLILNAGRNTESADTVTPPSELSDLYDAYHRGVLVTAQYTPGPRGGAFDSRLASNLGEVYRAQIAKLDYWPRTKMCAENRCAPEGIRTPNLLIRSQMLYPLSYGRLIQLFVADESAAAEARGFEPPVPFKGDNSLAVSPIRPLWHASRTT